MACARWHARSGRIARLLVRRHGVSSTRQHVICGGGTISSPASAVALQLAGSTSDIQQIHNNGVRRSMRVRGSHDGNFGFEDAFVLRTQRHPRRRRRSRLRLLAWLHLPIRGPVRVPAVQRHQRPRLHTARAHGRAFTLSYHAGTWPGSWRGGSAENMPQRSARIDVHVRRRLIFSDLCL